MANPYKFRDKVDDSLKKIELKLGVKMYFQNASILISTNQSMLKKQYLYQSVMFTTFNQKSAIESQVGFSMGKGSSFS